MMKRLSTLQGEMRNRIYRMPLLESERIELTKPGFTKEPGLLRVSRAVRRETYEVSWLENSFTFTVVNFDCSELERFAEISPNQWRRKCTRMELILTESHNWANLENRVQLHYAGKVCSVREPSWSSEYISFAAHVLDLSDRRGRAGAKWAEIESVLEDVHAAVPAWKN